MMSWYQKRHAPSWFSHESSRSSHARATSSLPPPRVPEYNHTKKEREAEGVTVRMVNDFLHRSRAVGSDALILNAIGKGIPLEKIRRYLYDVS